jgi:hypothetical protein
MWDRAVFWPCKKALEQMVTLGGPPPYDVIQPSLAHSHTERVHQGLGNHLIARERNVSGHTGQWGDGSALMDCSATLITVRRDPAEFGNSPPCGIIPALHP